MEHEEQAGLDETGHGDGDRSEPTGQGSDGPPTDVPVAGPVPGPVAGTWPPPHPSPPLPPPRAYGSPGTPPPHWQPWAWAAVAAVVVGLLVSYGLVKVIGGLTDDGTAAADPGSSQTGPTSGTTGPASGSGTPSAGAAAYRCWDGTDAAALSQCSEPTGEAGLRWVFPALADQKCAEPATDGGDGVLLRVLCLYRLADGTRIQVGYFEWSSVGAGEAFYDDQGLARADVPGADGRPVQYSWSGTVDGTVKAARLFVDEPFSYTVTLPTSASVTAADEQALTPRPADQLRGQPVG